MSPLAWLIVIFFVLCVLVVLVYGLVVRAFYWGDKKEPPRKKTGTGGRKPDADS